MNLTMGLFWQITGEIVTWTIRKIKAARTRISGCNGHYMGLNFSVFWQTGGHMGLEFREE
jgi:hypothetical protein